MNAYLRFYFRLHPQNRIPVPSLDAAEINLQSEYIYLCCLHAAKVIFHALCSLSSEGIRISRRLNFNAPFLSQRGRLSALSAPDNNKVRAMEHAANLLCRPWYVTSACQPRPRDDSTKQVIQITNHTKGKKTLPAQTTYFFLHTRQIYKYHCAAGANWMRELSVAWRIRISDHSSS